MAVEVFLPHLLRHRHAPRVHDQLEQFLAVEGGEPGADPLVANAIARTSSAVTTTGPSLPCPAPGRACSMVTAAADIRGEPMTSSRK